MIIEYFKHMMLTKVGTSHIQLNMPCQDSVFYHADQGVHVLVVSDGAGSKSLSHYGSKCIVETIGKHLPSQFTSYLLGLEKHGKTQNQIMQDYQTIKDDIMTALLKDLNVIAKRESVDVDELAGTLLFVAFNQHAYISGHIGDGFISSYLLNEDKEMVRVVSEPEGEANETYFVTTKGSIDHLRVQVGSMKDIRGFLLSSDGIQERCYHRKFGLTSSVTQLFNICRKTDQKGYENFFDKLIKETWIELDDDLSLNIILKDTLPLDDTNLPILEPYLSKIKSMDQIIKRSPYSFFIDPSLPYKDIDFMSSIALIERIKRL
jgi:hypothetical protein